MKLTMRSNSLFFALFIATLLVLPSCNSSDKNQEQQQESTEDPFNLEGNSEEGGGDATSGMDDLKGALDEMEKAVNRLQEGSGEKVEVVDFRKLKELLPERIGGLKRVSAGGEKTGVAGIRVSQAEAEYEDGESKMEVSIVDVGGMSMALAGLATWSAIEIDRESDEEVERTTTLDGHKAYEKYNFKTKTGETSIIVDKRFVVNIKGQNIQREDLTRARKKLKLDRLSDY